MRLTGRRVWAGFAIALLALMAGAGVANADAAGPTDYRSTVVAVMPETPGVEVGIEGFDAFLAIAVEPGTTVDVLGYQSEPFIRVLPDGTVEENERSPSVYVSRSRDGNTDVPEFADPTLPPSWKVVASGGNYAWHDHRVHWMSPDAPPANPGDVIQTGSVPMVVDGVSVTVVVETTLVAPPETWPVAVGAIAGLVLIVGALLTRRLVAWALLAGALAALAIGWWQFSSLPAVTDPSLVWWLLPAVAAVSALLAIVAGRRMVAYGLVVLGAIELAVWVFLRRDGIWKALIPTDAPQAADRAVMGFAAVAALAAAVGGVIGLYRTGD
ncbi:MAG: hypothetical protein ACK5OX_14460 [Desertimonas sp.]